jgi:hypothetical protein
VIRIFTVPPPDVCGAPVRFGRTPAPPAAATVDTPVWDGQARLVANRRHVHLEVAEVGRFAVEDGALITVEPTAGADPDSDSVTDLLHGALAAFVLAQRGEFALHASTVAIGPTGLALAGRSGAGKSTTALVLERRGHLLVTDDMSPLRPAVAGGDVPEVVPSGRRPHVWPDTAAALGLDLTGSRLVDRRLAKLSLPPRVGAPVPLHGVVVLRPDPSAARIDTARLTGLAAVPALLDNVYRVRLLSRLWATDLLTWAADLSRLLSVWVLTRPAGGWSAQEVADAVEAVAVRKEVSGAGAG